MEATIEVTTDKRSVVKVLWRRESPDDSEPELEAVFSIFWPTDLMLMNPTCVLHLLSATRVDTREPVELKAWEMGDIFNAAARAADDYDQRLLKGEG